MAFRVDVSFFIYKDNMKNYEDLLWWQKILSVIAGICLCFIIFPLALVCYLIEHIYNFFMGKGWIGLNYFEG
jgi:hypothetical protein